MSDVDSKSTLSATTELNGTVSKEKIQRGWVKFDDDSQTNDPLSGKPASDGMASTSEIATQVPAVLKPETVHINLERGDKIDTTSQVTLSKNVEFVNIRQGFCKF